MKQELDWGIRLTSTDNGYIAEWDELMDRVGDNEEDVVKTHRVVFEDKEDSDNDLDAIESLLWFLIDFFGKARGRHDKERLRVTREPGDKYEDVKEEVKTNE